MAGLETKLTLVGGPTLLIEIAGLRILTDPTFDPPGQYEGGVVLEKTIGPALTSEALGPVDAVLLSHDQHFDNLDRAGRAFLEQVNVVYTTRAGAQRLGCAAVGLSPMETVTLKGPTGADLHVTGTPARHGPVGFEPISGDVIGFVLGCEQPGDAIYITGDTVWYEGVAEVARQFKPRLVVVFAGAARPRGPFHVTMDNNDALETAHAFPDARIVVIHNSGWKHFSESAEDAVKAFTTLGAESRLITLEPGKPASLTL